MSEARGHAAINVLSTATDPAANPDSGGIAKDDLLATHRNWIKEMRGSLMVVATTVAWCAYRSGVNPPGGFWRDNKDGHVAGQPVMLTTFPASYTRFKMCSTMAWHTSVIIMVVLLSSYRTWARMTTLLLIALFVFDIACLFSLYAIATSPQDPIAGLAYLLPAVIICVLIYSLVHVGMAIGRLVRRLANKLR